MFKSYLRLDFFESSKKKYALIDSEDLESGENVGELLRQFANIASLAKLNSINVIDGSLNKKEICSFRRIKMKGKDKYQWILSD